MYRLVVEEHLSSRGVAARLTEHGILSPKGKPFWQPGVINYMLRQEVYCGTNYFGRREPVEPVQHRAASKAGANKKSSRRTRDRDEWIAMSAPAIIERATWEAAQVQMRENSKFSPRNNRKNLYLLRGLLRCDRCGKGYTGDTSHKYNKVYRYYSCSTKDPLTAPDGQKCNGPRISADVLEQTIWESVTSILRDPETLRDEFLRRVSQPQQLDTSRNRRMELEAELRQLSDKSDRFLDLYGDKKYDRESLDRKIAEVWKRRHGVEKELEELSHNADRLKRASEGMENLVSFCITISEGLEKLSFDERQGLFIRY